MDRFPVTASPRRFLLPQSATKDKAGPLQHQASQSSASNKPNGVLASSTLNPLRNIYTSEITSTSNTAVVNPSIRRHQSLSATGTQLGMRAEEAESLVAGRGNAGTAGGRALDEAWPSNAVDGMLNGGKRPAYGSGEGTEMPTGTEMQTPRGSQFKAVPRFRFGSSQRPRYSSPSRAEPGNNPTPQSSKPRWRATQTPLRQSLRKEVAEEEIVHRGENEALVQAEGESVESGDVDGDTEAEGGIPYSQLIFETPAAKRTKIGTDPVDTSSYSRNRHDDARSYDLEGAEARSVQQADRLEKDCSGRNDKEMLYNDDQEPQAVQAPLQDFSRPIFSTHHPPPTTASHQSRRPRFTLPTARPPRPSTPQPQFPQQTFAPIPHFAIATPMQAHTNRDNEPPSTIRTFAATPHFFISAPTHPHLDDEPQFIKPPKFVHVEEPEPEPAQPLPEEFSPRKRGHKFVVGGMAQEVRGWLVDLEMQNQRGNFATRMEKVDEGCIVKMTVEEVNTRAGGFTIAKGDGLNVILAGMGMSDGVQETKGVVKGSVVGIKTPAWEVDIEGMRYAVGVNWKMWQR